MSYDKFKLPLSPYDELVKFIKAYIKMTAFHLKPVILG
jgi:hypothetical protein